MPIRICTLFAVVAFLIANCALADELKPNIIVILADDLGYGDVQPNNPDSKIPTPAFNRLAIEGLNYTDAHSGSGVCTPTRYGLVCGRYCWRTNMKRGVLSGYSKPLIAKDRQTIGSVLGLAGYHTGCVGKWHLGLGWQWKVSSPDDINSFGIAGRNRMVDYSLPITDGPTHHGFDESYIIPASLDMSPYVYIKNDRVTMVPDQIIDAVGFPKFYRKGEISEDFKHVDCLRHLLGQAQGFIRENSKTEKPFFLYFPMPAPHKPVIPMKEFQGKTSLGPYGDFVAQVDWTVGQILETLDELKIASDTLVIVTSDNGSFMHRYDEAGKEDHVDDESVQGFRAENHRANGPLRGTKADVYEAGHRVPFFVRWPAKQTNMKIRAGEKSDRTICLTDILATVADVAGATVDQRSAEDSFSFLDDALVMCRRKPELRPMVINHSAAGMFAVRDQNWKLVFGNGSGGRQAPKGKPFEKPYQLYDLGSDLGETNNVFEQYAAKVESLTERFEAIAHGDEIAQPPRKKPGTTR